MTAPSEIIRRALSSMSPGDGMLRIHTLNGDTIRIVRRHGGWLASFRADRMSGGLAFVTDGPMLDLVLTDTDTSVSQKLSLLSASVGGVSFWDGEGEPEVMWGASA